MDTIQGLLVKRTELEAVVKEATADINSIDRVLVILGHDKNAKIIPVVEVEQEIGFPKEATRRDQILWILSHFNKPVRKKDFLNKFFALTGSNNEFVVMTTLKRLINENKVRAVKYNNENVRVYYGLIEWVDVKDYKSEYYPSDIHKGKLKPSLITEVTVAGQK